MFETTLSAHAANLYQLAVEAIVVDRTSTIIFCHGQAAQLDGALARPDYETDAE